MSPPPTPHRDFTAEGGTPPPTVAATAESAGSHSTEDLRLRQPQAEDDAASSHGDKETSDAKESSPPSSGDNFPFEDNITDVSEAAASNDEAKCVLEMLPIPNVDQAPEDSSEKDEEEDGKLAVGDIAENGAVVFTVESEDESSRSGSDVNLVSNLDFTQSQAPSESQASDRPPKTSGESSWQQNHLAVTEEPSELFDRQESTKSTDELLLIMGAGDPKPRLSSTSSATSATTLLENPYFLHIRVSASRSGFNHTYTPLSEKGIEIPQDPRLRDSSPRLQLVRSTFCFAIPERR